MQFEYLMQCYNETLRIEPPASASFEQTVTTDLTIGDGILLKKGIPY